MIAARKEESRSLLNLVIVGAVAAATIVVFFGVAFLWLGPLSPAMQPADPAPAAEALVTPEVAAPANDTMPGSSSAPPADNVAATATSGAASDQEMLAMGSIAIGTAITRPARITHAKRVTAHRHRRGTTTVRNAVVSWRLNAYPGPNPGGGFYGPPNINVGYINPR